MGCSGIGEIGRGQGNIAEVGHGTIADAQSHQPARMRNAAGIQQDGIGDREHGDIRTDAQCQRQHGDQGKSRRLAQLAESVTKLMQKRMHSKTSRSAVSSEQ